MADSYEPTPGKMMTSASSIWEGEVMSIME